MKKGKAIKSHASNARAKTQAFMRTIGIFPRGLSEISSFTGKAARYLTTGEDEFDENALKDEADFEALDKLLELEQKPGVRIDYERIAKATDKQEIREIINESIEDAEDQLEVNDEIDDEV